MLPDTLGIMNPELMTTYLNWMHNAFPNLHLDFHGHNDYGLATANSLAAVNAGINGIHTTVNGLGERTGNQSLCEIAAAIHDMTTRRTHICEKQLQHASVVVQSISGKRTAWNTPIVGGDVFTQTCGVHADGDKKGNLYANPLLPERFGRKRRYALGKLSGKASVDKNLEAMGLELDKATRDKVLMEVVRLGDKKKSITPEDLPFIISSILKSPIRSQVEVTNYSITTRRGEIPHAEIEVKYRKRLLAAESTGDGGYDAFVKALRKALKQVDLTFPRLLDYEVRIPPGGKTDALVETTITWENLSGAALVTIGVDSDQMVAAIKATEKMLNLVLAEKK
jgi:D-citramalate synthase